MDELDHLGAVYVLMGLVISIDRNFAFWVLQSPNVNARCIRESLEVVGKLW